MATTLTTETVSIHTEPLGGGSLARQAMRGEAPPAWYVPRPRATAGWREHLHAVAGSARRDWLDALAPALGRAPSAAAERLARVAREGGVVVTTGQQPGLFGGPIYTWSKAMSALALADAIESETGVPAAPLFWAATDDADLAEASETWVALPGGAERLRMAGDAPEGTPMAAVPLPPLARELEVLARGAGSAANAPVLDLARHAYAQGATVGGAYLALLRGVLEPLGIPVLDAAHDAVRRAAQPMLRAALADAPAIAVALEAREAELRAAAHEPQVAQVAGRTLVFAWERGIKRRLGIGEQPPPGDASLSANVLLRPVVERSLVPTAAYLAGPGELAYFAQATAVADALRLPRPLALPRWSCTIVEPQVERLLARLGVARDELASPHAPERRLERAAMPPALRDALAAWELAGDQHAQHVRGAAQGLIDQSVVDGAAAWMRHRLARLERRALAAIARRESDTMRDLATARGVLYPGGTRQERALNLLPMLARHGTPLLESMLASARVHASSILGK